MDRRFSSPNFGERRSSVIDLLLLHYTGMEDAESAIARLCDPAAQVSAHYLIDDSGMVFALVPEEKRAWHAGVAFWAGERDVNSRSIGIELANPGHELGPVPYPPAQMAALAELCRDILGRHPIPPHRVVGHADVAPERKRDPGEWFDWRWLAEQGIGLWPGGEAVAPAIAPAAGLRRIGYERDDAPVLAAFQRHWRPALIDGTLDDETRRRIAQVAAAIPG